jgi:hypothetical protein
MKSTTRRPAVACLLFFAVLFDSCSKSSSGNNNNSNPPPTQTIASPTALAATNITDSSFTAVWHSVSGATGYQLFAATDSAFVYPITGFNPKSQTDTSAVITNLNATSPYYYKVKAVNANLTSSASNTIKLTTL